jgi:hypothetical protein
VRTGAPAFEQIFGTSLFDYYAARPDAARVGAEGLKSVGRGQDAAVAPQRLRWQPCALDLGSAPIALGRIEVWKTLARPPKVSLLLTNGHTGSCRQVLEVPKPVITRPSFADPMTGYPRQTFL